MKSNNNTNGIIIIKYSLLIKILIKTKKVLEFLNFSKLSNILRPKTKIKYLELLTEFKLVVIVRIVYWMKNKQYLPYFSTIVPLQCITKYKTIIVQRTSCNSSLQFAHVHPLPPPHYLEA